MNRFFVRLSHSIIITSRAAEQIQKIQSSSRLLKIQVVGGGCHGYTYKITLDNKLDTDLLFTKDGAQVAVDDTSLPFLNGATLDYTNELIGSSFNIIDNPNADSNCGCKVSFNIK